MSKDLSTASTAPASPRSTPPASELLTMGYLYLLVLGIANQSLFYGLLGVNFLAWSDVLDVLISPIALLTGHPGRLTVIVLLVALLYPYTKWIRALAHKRRPVGGDERMQKEEAPLLNAWLVYSACVLVFGYIGFAAGGGLELRERLAEGDARVSHRVDFRDGRSFEVELVGKNTGFLFYFVPGDTELSIVPLADNVQRVQRLGKSAGAGRGQGSEVPKSPG